MRNNFIQELYYGNIAPHGDSASQNQELKKAWERVSEKEEMLNKRLLGEDNKLFREYVNSYNHAFSMNDELAFIRGFKIGARLIFDAFDNVDELMFI